MLTKLVSFYLFSASLLFVSDNCKEQIHIDLNEEKFNYVVIPNEKEIVALWNISVEGSPSPSLYLYADDERIDSNSSKYDYNITKKNIFVKIRNVSENVLNTKFSLLAENIYEIRTLNLTFNVTNLVSDGIEVQYLNETDSIIKCVAKSILKPDITWLACSGRDIETIKCLDTLIKETESERIELQLTSYLHIKSSWNGYLKCVAKNSMHIVEHTKEVLEVHGVEIRGYETLIDVDEKTKMLQIAPSEDVKLWCAASAHNHSNKIRWALNSIENNLEEVESYIDNTVFGFRCLLFLNNTFINSTATFFCKTWLNNGTMEYKQIEITVGSRNHGTGYNVTNVTKNVSGSNDWIYYTAAFLLSFFGATVTKIRRTYNKRKRKMDELKIAGLAKFMKGDLEHLNPNLTLDDQADLLPYDKRYEFPADQLELGDVIGSGAFGVVVKGEARGLVGNELSTTVAIKMVNQNTENVHIKALVSELKVLIHLGKHVNVVNLLGACTKNITKRELLVIVEYCRFGNLKDYLMNNRHTFIDQINVETGQIDFCIGSDVSRAKDPEFLYVTPLFSSDTYEHQGSSSSYKLSQSDKEEVKAEKAQTNQNIDYRNVNNPVCTRDLLLWSFQVARGMEYLSSRKVLHGDLAARNILLTDGNVVKICDFGLAKKMYQNDIYKKTGGGMLPVKWMAIEAIIDRIFSVQSDVWSFGIALWEFFSLARTPYPSMEFNENFCEKLLDGYRMKSPQFATQEIYQIMLRCWHPEPLRRPSFTELSQEIGSLLEETIRDHYIGMNSGYVEMNAEKLKEENADCLSMVAAPDFNKYSSPCSYINMLKSSLNEEFNNT